MPLHHHEHPTLVRLANFHRSSVPAPPKDHGPPLPAKRLVVFGIGTDWVQLTWSRLGPGDVMVRIGDSVSGILADGGPGAHTVRGLSPGAEVDIELSGAGLADGPIVLKARTLTAPPGEELFRMATVSDAHLGCNTTGYLHTIAEIPTPAVPHTVRCLRAAQTEAAFWGASDLIVKGDLVDISDREKWAMAADVLGGSSMDVAVIPGNHERSKMGDVDPYVGAAEVGLLLVEGTHTIDRNGVRLILADTTRPGTDVGQIDRGDEIVALAADTSDPVLIGIHHQIVRHPIPTYLPIGILRSAGRQFLHDLGGANHRALVTSGHTHRHRRYDVGPVTVTEVGSTKDFPGTWAGYQFFEGGVVQTVRRTAEPSVIRWTDHTRRAALGVWGYWAPGPVASRCFSRSW